MKIAFVIGRMPDLAEDVSDGAASSTAALSAAARAVCFSPPTAPAGPLRVEPQRAPSGSLTEEEFSTIAKLRELLEVSWSSWTDGGKAEAAAHSDDFTLLRFIKARPDDVSKALEMFKESMEWRHTRGINQLFAELHPCAPQSSRHDAVRKYYFGGAGGMTLEGGAYFVLRVGQADLGGISREPKVVSLMMDADAINMETIFRCVRACSAATGKFERVHVVVDVAGFSLATLRHVGMVKDIMKVRRACVAAALRAVGSGVVQTATSASASDLRVCVALLALRCLQCPLPSPRFAGQNPVATAGRPQYVPRGRRQSVPRQRARHLRRSVDADLAMAAQAKPRQGVHVQLVVDAGGTRDDHRHGAAPELSRRRAA